MPQNETTDEPSDYPSSKPGDPLGELEIVHIYPDGKEYRGARLTRAQATWEQQCDEYKYGIPCWVRAIKDNQHGR